VWRLYATVVLLCLVALGVVLAGCEMAAYAPPDPEATVAEPAATTAMPDPEVVTTASETSVEVTTTTLAPTTTSKSTTTTSKSTTTTAAPTTTTVAATPGAVLYEITDWSGASGWALTGQWKTVSGMLVCDGSEDSGTVAPLRLGDQANYAVEAEIQIIDPDDAMFWLEGRLINGVGYTAGAAFDWGRILRIGYGYEAIGQTDFSLDGEWHTYRFELYDNSLKLFFDGAEVTRAMDNRILEPGTVGIYSSEGQINVRAFRVIAL
jgi:hypothetical protein